MRYGIKGHKAVIVIFGVITLFTILRQLIAGSWNAMMAMSDFMAGYFLIFGFFKLIDLKGFVTIYAKYNMIAEYFVLYAYLFPFIQLSIGMAYLLRVFLLPANIINFIIMSLGLISIVIKLLQKQIIPCGCLGTLFQHPLSLVSLLENLLMVVMAFSMVIYHL